ncbi:MAG: hypothetical protein LBQ36_05575, partial [Synergistaceae bacterium]|nr:hypothetical protein [Synergistaceae bacterium]
RLKIYSKEMTTMARKSLSRWDEIVSESNEGIKIWVGVDVHKTSYAVAVLSGRGVCTVLPPRPTTRA